ncbi:hypothetical protein DIURU_004186 [Diutina rugosa]|uniref:Calcineurin-like phosphoesterase domain-containing protein n=1 Tax=Diutina rugosa TaxID=5481 RepID=A0A642UIL0_DIURU|nr:uncharacterized protein DIURU_004186 [Diutina rugosa]KAA8899703.1 hypothetical protein DIURU_004186 [Diutina rugosa]
MKEYVRAYSPRPPQTRLHFNWKFVVSLFVVWVSVIHFFERIQPGWLIGRCQWNRWEQAAPDHHRVAIIADPQIIDDYSYPKLPRWFQRVFEFCADNYLRRNYRYIEGNLDPDTVIFLGDLFDGGREWNTTGGDDVWFNEFKRFSSIYDLSSNRRHYWSVPGNHDIGFQNVTKAKSDRFAQFFGELNRVVEIGNHSIVMIDTISLSHPNPEVNTEANEFLTNLEQHIVHPDNPRILLTHVPLYRWPDKQRCGPRRERNHRLFPLMRGVEYQTVIEYEISKRIMQTVGPTLILAGDDHDYCDIKQEFTHKGRDMVAREITVKAAGMTGGVKYPAIQLLSLHTGGDSNSYSTEMCYMPAAYSSVKTYGYLFMASVAFLGLLYLFPSRLNHFTKRTNQLLNDSRLKQRWYYWVDEERNWSGFWLHLVLAFVIPVGIWIFYVRSLYHV